MATNPPHVRITELVFNDGTKVKVSPNDVFVIVGPNNSGKSAALRGIRDKLQDDNRPNPVIRQLSIDRSGSLDDLRNWLEEWTFKNFAGQPGNPTFQALGVDVYEQHLQGQWQRPDSVLGGLSRFFCHLLTADERLQIANPPGNISLTREGSSHPIHFLLRDDRLELRLSAKFRMAFGVDLIVHRNAGNHVPLHVGERPVPLSGEDRVSLSYVKRLELLPTLHSQGDGMRSFAGVILASSVARESILLIDEPEAFLHPPQARLLGTALVQDRREGRQLFIATHSTDLLRGILDSESPDVRVLRLTRHGNTNTVRLLDNSRIQELWGDPLLRYSNILDGLFHESVIVCEGDADCRFLAAINDSLHPGISEGPRRPDLMFTHCGGKARLPVLIRALREVDVPVKAVADFDILSDEQPLRSVLDALGLEWSSIVNDWQIMKNAIDGKKPELNTQEVSENIRSLLSNITDTIFPARAKDEIQAVLRRSSPWSTAKTVGKPFIPSGQPAQACERLLQACRNAGLHIVEGGESENFSRLDGGHGPKWVNTVLQRDLARDPELTVAREFVRQLVSSSSFCQ
jgi:energy-coupling factor transporter ATP-binding protein EcfA2